MPGCEEGRVTEDCCYRHSLQTTAGGERWLPNDGIIDQQAIDLAVSGARTVGLTWVEAEIAIGTMIARGLSQEEILNRLNINIKAGSPRCIAYHRVAHAVLND